jgi:hypothetical protein
MDQDIYGLTGVAKSAAAFVSAEPKPTTKPPKKKKKKSAPPKTTTDTFVPLVVPMDDVDAQVAELEKQKKEALNKYLDLYNKAATKEELQRVVKEWLDVDILSKEGSNVNVRGALDTPGGFEKGKELFLEDNQSTIKFLNKQIAAEFDAKIAALKNGAATTTTTKPPVTTKVDIEVAKDLLRQLIRGKVITEFTPDEQKILGDPSIITQELRDTLTKEFNDSKPEVVKGSVIRMTNGELVQVKNITKGKITVVPLMDDTAAEDVIDEADITDRQIVASPSKKKTVKTTPDVDTKEVIDDSVTQANGLAASKDDQAKLANEAKEMTPEERLAAVKGELRNRCNTGTKKKK